LHQISVQFTSFNLKLESQLKELQEKTTKVASLEEDILTKKTQILNLQSIKNYQAEQINKLNLEIVDFKDKVVSLESNIRGKLEFIGRLTCDAEMMSKDVESKAAQVVLLETEAREKTDQIAQIQNELITDKNL